METLRVETNSEIPSSILRAPEAVDDEGWHKHAVIYQLHVRSFRDSDGDGIGDFKGLTEALDYLQDLGITALWLLPFYPSPLKDDGYDIADYTNIHPAYGTLDDFKNFLNEAHARDIKVITELVINHTSDQHPWFQRARLAKPGSVERNFYVWSQDSTAYGEARIIFKDFEASNWTWDPVAGAHYWHRFFSHQPDLNFDNPAVHQAVTEVLDFWMDLGVDGMRLDAVPYLFEREGTNCENLPETHAYLKALRRHMDSKYKDRILLAEANQWPEDASAYFGDADECHMNFHFPLMPRMFMSLSLEDRFPIIDIMAQTPAIPDNCQWATFLRNHDELTLEMVTDEERDYMYRVYASDKQARINLGIRRRLAPLLGNNRRKIELMNGLLFSLPGTPILYYGDEIGMGDNIYLGDRNGVRTPFQWNSDKNAGFSRSNPQKLFLPVIIDPEYHFESINVETQHNNENSLLWWMKRLISSRKRFRALHSGSIEFLHPENRRVLSFLRRHGTETILVVANLSRLAQCVELDLKEFQGMRPVEIFGQTRFPNINEHPYFISLGAYSFYWFSLEAQPGATTTFVKDSAELPLISLPSYRELFNPRHFELEGPLKRYIKSSRWFRSKSRVIKSMRLNDLILWKENGDVAIFFLDLEYTEGESETYVLPLQYLEASNAKPILLNYPQSAIARISSYRINGGEEGYILDALYDRNFDISILELLIKAQRIRGRRNEVFGFAGTELKEMAINSLPSSLLSGEQSNSSILFDSRLIFKFFRKLEKGVNPDLEIGRHLTNAGFKNSPAIHGFMELRGGGDRSTMGILYAFIPNEEDAWKLTLGSVDHFYERAITEKIEDFDLGLLNRPLLQVSFETFSHELRDLIGPYLEQAGLIGVRTAELHLALARDTSDPAFRPERINSFYGRSLYQRIRSIALDSTLRLSRQMSGLSSEDKLRAELVVSQTPSLVKRFAGLIHREMDGKRIRCHGDYHLGQLLYTGKDFVIVDFEGEPSRPLSERTIKRPPLQDVAGMIRSFHYASQSALSRKTVRLEDLAPLRKWAMVWTRAVTGSFLGRYLETMRGSGLLPSKVEDLSLLLNLLIVEKAFYEVSYELNNRPDWIGTPLEGLLQIMAEEVRNS